MNSSDDKWLRQAVGDVCADVLWPLIQLAETERLIRVYGYAKDNAIPPSLPQRLSDRSFVGDLLETVEDSEESQALSTLLRAIVWAE